jgi:hypothetical protein
MADGRAQVQAEVIQRVTSAHRKATMTTLRVAFLSALALELTAALATALVAVEIGLRLLAGHVGYQTALLVLLLTPEAYLPLRNAGAEFHASTEGSAAAERMPVPDAHFVNRRRIAPPFPDGLSRAVFGMGCFWGAEKKFWPLAGVYSTAVGYAGGPTPNPTYREVCTGMTGHNEVVLVVFDTLAAEGPICLDAAVAHELGLASGMLQLIEQSGGGTRCQDADAPGAAILGERGRCSSRLGFGGEHGQDSRHTRLEAAAFDDCRSCGDCSLLVGIEGTCRGDVRSKKPKFLIKQFLICADNVAEKVQSISFNKKIQEIAYLCVVRQ